MCQSNNESERYFRHEFKERIQKIIRQERFLIYFETFVPRLVQVTMSVSRIKKNLFMANKIHVN